MGKLECPCGRVLSDISQEESEKYCGIIAPYRQINGFEEHASQDVVAYLEATRRGTAERWIADHFGPDYPADQSEAEIVNDIISKRFLEVGLAYGRCTKCGSLLVQRRAFSHHYYPYKPDGERSEGI